jgi:hypothetical protein
VIVAIDTDDRPARDGPGRDCTVTAVATSHIRESRGGTRETFRWLLAVAEHLHFGRAADICHVSQPTVSAQVRKFENELAAALFERTRRQVGPTTIAARPPSGPGLRGHRLAGEAQVAEGDLAPDLPVLADGR